MNFLKNGIKAIAILLIVTSCRKKFGYNGHFWFINETKESVNLKCYNRGKVSFDQVIKPKKEAQFAGYIVNTNFSIPEQTDSIIIVINSKKITESCAYPINAAPWERKCSTIERSFFNMESYIVERNKRDLPEFYYYFTEEDAKRAI